MSQGMDVQVWKSFLLAELVQFAVQSTGCQVIA